MANKKITQLDAVQEALGTDWLPVGREGSNQGTRVSIEQIEEYVEQTIKGNASAGTSDDDIATIGYVNDAVADAGGDSIELETEINSVNPSDSKAPTSKAVADYVSGGLSDKVDTNQIGVANGVAPLGADGKIPTTNLPNNVMQNPEGGTLGQILQKTEDGYEWDDMPSIEDGENPAVPLYGTIHVSAVDAQEGEDAGVEITPHTGGGLDMTFTLLKGAKGANGASGHNPCLGRFPDVPNPMPTAQVGDYLYVDATTTDPNTQEATITTTVYHYGSNGWDSGTVIDAEHPTFASGQNVTAVHIKDEDGADDTNAQGVLSAEAGKAMNIYSSETTEVVLDGSSPYHVSNITNAYITANLKKIESNAYTSEYAVALFQLPAGNYQVTYQKNSTASVVYLATINSAENFVLNGYVNTIIIRGDTAVRDEPVPIVLEEETYLVLCYSRYDNYDLWCKLEQVNTTVTTVKDKVGELDETVGDMQPIVNNTATAVDKLELLKTKETTVKFQLENDYDFFTSSYQWAKIGQYTKILTEDTTFNVVRNSVQNIFPIIL